MKAQTTRFQRLLSDLEGEEINSSSDCQKNIGDLIIPDLPRSTLEEKAGQLSTRQITELNVLYQVSSACAELEDEDQLIEKVTWIIGETFYPDNFGVFLLDEGAGVLRHHASYRIPEDLRSKTAPLGVGVVGTVATTGRTLRIDDAQRNPIYRSVITGMGSEICVPLKNGDRVIGVIDVERQKIKGFDEDDERLLGTLAGYLATAISRLRLFHSSVGSEKKLRAYAERLQTLREIDAAVLAAHSPESIAQAALGRIRVLLPSRRTSIALFDLERNEATVFASDTDGESSLGSGQHFPLTTFSSIPYLLEDGYYRVRDIQTLTEPSQTDRMLLAEGLRSFLNVALRSERRLIGSLNVASEEPDAFDTAHLEILQEIAASLSVALENAQLLHESQQQAEELSALNETALSMSGVLESEALLQVISERVQKIIKPDTFLFAQYIPESQEILLAKVIEAGEQMRDWESNRIPLADSGLTGWVIRNQTALLIGDMLEDELPVEPKHGSHPARSWLGVPLIARSRLLGVISVQSFRPEAFDNRHRRFLESLSIQAAITLDNVSLFEQTERRLFQVQALRDIDRAITTRFDLQEILPVILDQVKRQLKVDAVNILLYNSYTQSLKSAGRLGFHTGALRQTNLQLGESYAGRAALEERIVHLPDIWSEPGDLVKSPALALEGFTSYLAAPLITKGQVKGVLEIFQIERLEPEEEWFDFLEALANQAAIAIENASLFQELQRSNQELAVAYNTTLEGWSRALELRDRETEGHAQRVVNLTLKLARRLGIDEQELVHIRRGALLHDIGKLGVPDSILLKPGPLTGEEWEVMKQHPIYAYKLLSPIAFLRQSIDIPIYHHEKWDGTGYPHRLQGEEIPLPARVFAVVDVWDALNSDRPYRKAFSMIDTLDYLHKQSGKHFDPQVVKAFLELLEDVNLPGCSEQPGRYEATG